MGKTFLVELSQSHLSLMTETELQSLIKNKKSGSRFRIYIDEMNSWLDSDQMKMMPSEKREWYYLQNQKAIGVFNELEMIRFVQTKKLQPTQLVWKPGMPSWAEYCRTPEFNSQSLRQIVNEFPPLLESVFSKRQSRRIPFQADFLLHGQEKIWTGQSFEIGTGGIGIHIKGQGLSIGQTVQLHLLSIGQIQKLNVKAEIVSHLKDAKGVRPDRFGLKFTEIHSSDQQMLSQLVAPPITKG